ncbi:ACP phosphodiesterase [Maribellus sp. YY47]|uniref:acyl carrier protein phosphodiesterase n=1 Tax=Maribellus sp. YY47 TaxID=2929486 RepID=UPI0020018146|nr:ACP phosphodiesterase [Maribellus sp. YY47]MCK3686269.1 ACP phosphodiesterase [Maribellus sp. YY47]
MNYLAHLYLSGESEQMLVGNFIGDYVKGKQYENYPKEIADGILLHRRIDHFTDNHPLHKEAKKPFRDDFGHYAGIVVDLVYDHFLAANWTTFSDLSLRWFAKRSHSVLLSHFAYLPLRVQGFLPFLIQNRRLESYATIEGII